MKKKISIFSKKPTLTKVAGFFFLLYVLAIWGANLLWYKHHSFADFHLFDDLAEWQQMDKWGHIFAAFHLSSYSFAVLHFLLPERKILLLSSLSGFLLLSSIEILDGFSPAYGASIYDLAANFFGTMLFACQKHFFKKIFLQPKFSFHFSAFAAQRPNILGDSWLAQLLKDYNGQVYWYAFPVRFFPSWLQLSVGYSADNMLFGHYLQNEQVGLTPFRKYFIGLDISPIALKSRYSLLNSVISFTNLVRLPLPALEWSEQHGFVWHWIYF